MRTGVALVLLWMPVVALLSSVAGCGRGDSRISKAPPDLSGLRFEQLLKKIRDPDPEIRRIACGLLGNINDQRAYNAVLTLVKDSDKMVQATAVKALGERGDTQAVPLLQEILNGPDPVLPYHAVAALISIGGEQAIRPVLRKAGSDREFAGDARRLMLEASSPGIFITLIKLSCSGKEDKSVRIMAMDILRRMDGATSRQIAYLKRSAQRERDSSLRTALLVTAGELALKLEKGTAGKADDRPGRSPDASSAVDKQDRSPGASSVVNTRKQSPTVSDAASLAGRSPVIDGGGSGDAIPESIRLPGPVHKGQLVGQGDLWPDPEATLRSFLNTAGKHYRRGGRDRNRAIPFFNQGVSLVRRREYSAALAAYRQAVYLDSTFYEAYFNMANLLEEQGRTARALAVWAQVLRLRPNDPDNYYQIGLNLKHQGKLPQAWAFFTLAERFMPSNADYSYQAGLIAFQKKDYHRALLFIRRAAGFAPKRKDIFYNLAALYLNLNRFVDARSAIDRARLLGADVRALENEFLQKQN